MKEILVKLIAYYEKHIVLVPETNFLDYLKENYLAYGICYTSKKVFDLNIYAEDWVIDINPSDHYWTTPPFICNCRQNAINSLQFRIDMMKELLSAVPEKRIDS